jgi:hypothetical protein
VTLHDEESLKLRANRLFHLKSKTVGIRLTVGKESSYSLTRFCARLLLSRCTINPDLRL